MLCVKRVAYCCMGCVSVNKLHKLLQLCEVHGVVWIAFSSIDTKVTLSPCALGFNSGKAKSVVGTSCKELLTT